MIKLLTKAITTIIYTTIYLIVVILAPAIMIYYIISKY